MTIEEIKQKKRELGYTNEDLARLSHVPLSTVQKVLGGVTKSPRYQTIESLSKVVSARPSASPSMFRESSAAAGSYSIHSTKGKMTVDDYYQLPEERRVELIDGVFYDMAAPLSRHQLIQVNLATDLTNFIRSHGGPCLVYSAPIDVQLDRNAWTMLQPDIIILCDRTKDNGRCIFGAPDFVAEILSPSSKTRDAIIKLAKYKAAGVKEYWIIDPEAKVIYVYDFIHDRFPQTYTFYQDIPVNIWDGQMKVNLSYLDSIIQ